MKLSKNKYRLFQLLKMILSTRQQLDTRTELNEKNLQYSDLLFRDGFGHQSIYGMQQTADVIYETIMDQSLLPVNRKTD